MAYSDNEKRILGVTSAAHYMTHLFELFFPAVALTVRDDMGWSLAEVLQLSFLMYLLFGLGALPMGFLTDRWRAQRVLALSMLGASLGAFATALAQTPLQFMLALGLIGISISAYHPAGMSLISRTLRQRGKALGVNGVFGNLGSATAPIMAGVLAFQFGWRSAYVVLGLAGLLIAVLTAMLSMEEKTTIARRHQDSGGRARGVLWFAVLCLAMMFAGFSYRGVSLVLPASFEQGTTFVTEFLARFQDGSLGSIDNLAATLLASAVYAMGMIGQVVGGHFADRYDLRKMYLFFHATSLPFLLAMSQLSGPFLLVSAGIFVFFSLGMQPIENSLVARLTPEKWRSTSYGVKFILNFGVGALAVYLVADLQNRGGYGSVYLAMAAFVFLVAASTVVLWLLSHRVRIVNEKAVEILS